MPTRPNSRIEVDLKLLEDKNVQRLQEFGKQFDASITRLADALKHEADTLENRVSQQSGRLSPDASTGAHFTSPTGVRLGGVQAGGGGFGGVNYTLGGGGGYGGGSGSVAGPDGVEPTPGTPESFEQQFVRAQRRIGEIPVGLRQMLGYYAEGGFKGDAPAIDEAGYFIDKNGNRILGPEGGRSISRSIAGKVNTAMFQQQAIMANVRRAYGGMNSIFASIAAPTQLGQQLGASREGGWLGTGFMSPAFRRGFMENFNAMRAADFGFNPNYSVAQARAARATTQGMGYSGQMADVINEQMKQLQIHQQIDPGTVMAMLDPLLRYGGWQSGAQLVDVLRAIPEAAKAASFNLKTFTEQLQSASLEIAQQTGMQPGQVMSALSAFSATTGLAPQRAAGLFTANNLTLAAAMTGKTMTQLVENPSAAPEMAFGLSLFKDMTGMSAEQLLQLRKTNRNAYNHLMDGVYRMYEQNKEIFGGFSPLELINMSVRNKGNTRGHMAAYQEIQGMKFGAGSVRDIQSLLTTQYGRSEGSAFAEWRQNYLNDYFKKHQTMSQHDLLRFRQAAQDHALKMIADHQQKAGRRAAAVITLSPQASKWFDILTKDMGQSDTPGRNAGKSFWRRAMTLGSDIGGAVTDFETGHLIGAGKKAINVGVDIESGIASLF